MAISSASIPLGATYSPAGGTATSFVSLGQSEGQNKLFFDEGLDLINRRSMLVTSKSPVVNAGAPNGYTQQRSTVVFHSPLALDNGKMTTNSVKIEVAYDPESTAAEIAELWELAAHVAIDSDFSGLREDGSTA